MVHKLGDRFICKERGPFKDMEYMLALVPTDPEKAYLANIETGGYWGFGTKVVDCDDISKDELKHIFGSSSFIKKECESETLQEDYLKMQGNCGIKVGDKVRVLRKAESYEMGWNCDWIEDMDNCIGEIGEVVDINPGGFDIKFKDLAYWCFPFFVLEKVEEEYYCIGDKFRIEGSEYVLLNVSPKRVALFNTKTFNCFTNLVKVKDVHKITMEELMEIVFTFDLIEKSPLRKER
jgi:hypothetical protein